MAITTIICVGSDYKALCLCLSLSLYTYRYPALYVRTMGEPTDIVVLAVEGLVKAGGLQVISGSYAEKQYDSCSKFLCYLALL